MVNFLSEDFKLSSVHRDSLPTIPVNDRIGMRNHLSRVAQISSRFYESGPHLSRRVPIHTRSLRMNGGHGAES